MGNLTGGGPTRTIVIHPFLRSGVRRNGVSHARAPEARLDEAIGLAKAIDLEIIEARLAPLSEARPATLIGKGIVDEIGQAITDQEVGLAVVDGALSPVQQRNLERHWGCKVIDRTGLILEIFGARARTREGQLQVELASLSYQKSRLVKSWTHLERQRGGFGFLGGPGESQLEIDRRLIGERIAKLKRELEEVKRTRSLHRSARQRVPYPMVALVGYTNAGKSTLFNRLTHASVLAKDLLFATLDPTMRILALPSGRKAILSDTVGFISELPTHLVAAFRATLEEVLEADILIHVRDVAHADSDAQRDDVLAVLDDLGLGEKIRQDGVEALNKIDLIAAEDRPSVLNGVGRVPLSAATGEGCDALLALIDRRLAAQSTPIPLALDLADGAGLAWLYRHGQVLTRTDDDAVARLVVLLTPADAERFAARHGRAEADHAD